MKCPTGAAVMAGGPSRLMRLRCRASKPIVRCEWTTPFGSRVVPEVKATIAGASGSTAAGPVTGTPPSAAAKGVAAPGSSPGDESPTTSQGAGPDASNSS